jgi:hypothetical protein
MDSGNSLLCQLYFGPCAGADVVGPGAKAMVKLRLLPRKQLIFLKPGQTDDAEGIKLLSIDRAKETATLRFLADGTEVELKLGE